MKRLTQTQIANTIKNLNISKTVKIELQKQCNSNDQSVRFYVYSQYQKQIKKVLHKGKIYTVLGHNYIGNYNMYKLGSLFSGGAPFGVLKDVCKIM